MNMQNVKTNVFRVTAAAAWGWQSFIKVTLKCALDYS